MVEEKLLFFFLFELTALWSWLCKCLNDDATLDRYISFDIVFPTFVFSKFEYLSSDFVRRDEKEMAFHFVPPPFSKFGNTLVARFLFYLEFSNSPALYWVSPLNCHL